MTKRPSEKSQFTPGIGSSSIVVIFLLLCLVTLSALSLISANADMVLTQKAVTQTQAYYAAENKAQQLLARIDAICLTAYQQGKSPQGFREAAVAELKKDPRLHLVQGDTLQVYFFEEITPAQNLLVGLELQYPQQGEVFYHIIQWESEASSEWIPQSGMPLLGRD